MSRFCDAPINKDEEEEQRSIGMRREREGDIWERRVGERRGDMRKRGRGK